jgi:hypothetical protein
MHALKGPRLAYASVQPSFACAWQAAARQAMTEGGDFGRNNNTKLQRLGHGCVPVPVQRLCQIAVAIPFRNTQEHIGGMAYKTH